MKDNNHEKVCTQYEIKIESLEKDRAELEEKLNQKQSEYNKIVTEHNELINKNSALKEQSSKTEVLLKTKNEELIDIKDQLEILWNQSQHLTNLSPLPNIIPKTDLSVLKVLSESYNKAFNDSSNHLTYKKMHHIDTTCENCTEVQKPVKREILTNDVFTDTDDLCDINNDTISNNSKSKMNSNQILREEVSKCYNFADNAFEPEDMITKSTEKIRNFIVAELTSLQLLHSMLDLTINTLSTTKKEYVEPATMLDIPITGSKPHIDELTDKEDDRQSSSTPSGYETGSHRGSQVDINDVLISEYLADSEEEQTQKGLLSMRPSVSSQITDSLPYISTQELDLHGLAIDKVLMLYNEIDDQRKSIDQELLKIMTHFIGESLLGNSSKYQKRDFYSQLIQTLTDPILSMKFDLEQLEHLMNLVLVDHSITGCLLTLSYRIRTTDIKTILKRLTAIESCSESFYERVIDIDDKSSYENKITVNTDSSFFNDCIIKKEEPIDKESGIEVEPESPINRKKGIGRFLCVSLRSLRRSKEHRPKASKVVPP